MHTYDAADVLSPPGRARPARLLVHVARLVRPRVGAALDVLYGVRRPSALEKLSQEHRLLRDVLPLLRALVYQLLAIFVPAQQSLYTLLHFGPVQVFNRAMLCKARHLPRPASVRPSVRHTRVLCRNTLTYHYTVFCLVAPSF